MAATQNHVSHGCPYRVPGQGNRSFLLGSHRRHVKLHQLDLHLAVENGDEFVVGAGTPSAGAFSSDGLEDVLDVLGDNDLLVGPRGGGHLEDVREREMLRVIIDDLDVALFELLERTELG